MKLKVSTLTGLPLDWAVAQCENAAWAAYDLALEADSPTLPPRPSELLRDYQFSDEFNPSANWTIAGPIIEREEIELHVIPALRTPANWGDCQDGDTWCANICPTDLDMIKAAGPNPLVAAMRALVISKLGAEIDVPEELLA